MAKLVQIRSKLDQFISHKCQCEAKISLPPESPIFATQN